MDLDTLLAAADPARQDPAPGADSPQARRLYRQITAGSRRPPRARRGPRSRRPSGTARALRAGRVRVAVPLAAITACAAAAATALVLARPGTPAPAGRPHPQAQPRAAASRPASLVSDVLEDAARSAAAAPAGLLPGPGQYFYIKQTDTKRGGPGGSACATIVYQFWISRRGTGRERGSSPGCSLPQNHFQLKLSHAACQEMGYLDWPGLPTEPAALKRTIARRLHNRAPNGADLFLDAGMMLNADAPPLVRAALYRMIETLPGITDLGPMTDPLGRPGVGIGIVQHNPPHRIGRGKRAILIPGNRFTLMMIISPGTGAVLASAVGITRSPHGPGPRMNPMVNVVAGVVNSPTSTKPVRNLLPPVPGGHRG